MTDAREHARQLMAWWDEELKRMLPPGPVFDVHLHLGNDIDGMVGDYDELEAIHAQYGIERAFMFCLDEPDRVPAFRAANDRTLAYAERSEGRLIPFVRLDLTAQPEEEAVRCLDRGARGIKLHPRAQQFLLNDDRLAPIFALSQERRVPILIHGGRGLPPIADDLARLVERFPDAQLIIAHAGIADLAKLAGHFSGVRNVYFDTSTWSPIDLLDCMRQVSPEQMLYASDYPYGQQPSSLIIAIRTAQLAGYDERQLRDMLWDNARRIAEGEPQLELTAPVGGDTFQQPMSFARIHQYLSMATSLFWSRQPDNFGVMGLALNVCDEQNGHPREHAQIKELLLTARELWKALPQIEDDRERLRESRFTFRLIHLADTLAVTSGA